MDKFWQIAEAYARNTGYDSIRIAGEKGACKYYHAFNKANLGHKTGLPHIFKIDEAGKVIVVNDLKERMWAVSEETKFLKVKDC